MRVAATLLLAGVLMLGGCGIDGYEPARGTDFERRTWDEAREDTVGAVDYTWHEMHAGKYAID